MPIALLVLFMQVQLQISLPSIRFETAPAVVEVEPGMYVVPEREEEVFYVDGWYWTRWHDGRWYRTRSYRGGWLGVPPTAVPPTLVRCPPGRYRLHHARPERMRVVAADGSVTEYRVKEKHGTVEVKGKGKPWKGEGRGRGKGHGRDD
jgi:hypothetical protein